MITCKERSLADHTKQKKTVHTSTCEAHESTRKRFQETQKKHHEDHIAERRYNSMSHYNLVHKHIPMPQAPDAKAAVDKEWKS